MSTVCDWLEREVGIYTVGELKEKMEAISGDGEAYSKKCL